MKIENLFNRTRPAGGGCWLWLGAKSTDGYGVVTIGGTREYAHRLAFAIQHGPIPDGYDVRQRCHVRACIAPQHLRLVRGRLKSGRRVVPEKAR